MNNWKYLAILFSLFSFGAIQETYRILTSSEPNIADKRGSLIPMAIVFTGVFIFLTIFFWRKAFKKL